MNDTQHDPNAALLGVLNCFSEPTIMLSPDYEILLANEAYRTHYGFSDRLTQNRHCYRISHHYTVPCDMAGETCPLKESIASGQASSVLHVHHTPTGEEYVNVEMWPVKHPATDEILFLIERMHPVETANTSADGHDGLIGRSPAFKEMMTLISRVARADTNVMLLGESGTGKALAAQAVHRESSRAGEPFVTVACGGLTENQLDAALFGSADTPGMIEAAQGGTLFLDEIGEMPPGTQSRLLQLLDTRRFRRMEGGDWREADFRLVCASNRDLNQMVRAGTLRDDLFYRLSVFEIEVPPLRQRAEDVELLIGSILALPQNRGLAITDEALACLRAYNFPGNIRELANIVERAALLSDGQPIDVDHLPAGCREKTEASIDLATDAIVPLQEAERRYLQSVLTKHRGDRRSLAKRLGISERALYRKLASLKD